MYEKEKQIIQFLLRKIPSGLTKTELLKAMYLADYDSRRYRGKPISSFEYIYYHHGPYDYRYMQVIEQLVASGILLEKQFTSLQDRKGCSYSLLSQDIVTDQLAPGDIYILKHIVQSMLALEGCSLDILLQHIYSTEPMQNIERNQKLDMDQVNNICPGPFDGVSLEDVAIAEYEYQQGHCITLEELRSELQNPGTASHS